MLLRLSDAFLESACAVVQGRGSVLVPLPGVSVPNVDKVLEGLVLTPCPRDDGAETEIEDVDTEIDEPIAVIKRRPKMSIVDAIPKSTNVDVTPKNTKKHKLDKDDLENLEETQRWSHVLLPSSPKR